MADTVRKIDYFSVVVPNRPAAAFGVLSTLVSAKIDLLACSGVSRGRQAHIDVVPADTRKFKTAVRKAALEFTPRKSGFLIQGKDRTGALAEHLRKLGERGINVMGIDSTSAGEGRWGAIIWIDEGDVTRAARVLGAGASGAATPRTARTTQSRKRSATTRRRPR
jgi:hypothetical protein